MTGLSCSNNNNEEKTILARALCILLTICVHAVAKMKTKKLKLTNTKIILYK